MINSQKNITALSILVIGGFVLYNYKQKAKKEAPIYFRKNLLKNYNARTLPPFGIFIKEEHKTNQNLIKHELKHWHQYQKMGLIKFYSNYFTELKKFGYDNMPMEIEARELESAYCKTNYTECVRDGKALTIYNPNFRL